MIQICFDEKRNVPETMVERSAMTARKWGPRMKRITGLTSDIVSNIAIASAFSVANGAGFPSVSGAFCDSVMLAVRPLKADLEAAAMRMWGGVPVTKLPWLASENAIIDDYEVEIKKIGFVLDCNTDVPRVILSMSFGSDGIHVEPLAEATLSIGVANLPFMTHMPAGMLPHDLGVAMKIIAKQIHSASVALWVDSAGGTKEVF